MGRYGRRVSRGLIGVLIVTVVLGVAFYLKNTKTSQAQEAAPAVAAGGKSAPLAVAQPQPPKQNAVVVNKPATQPQAAASPATQPQQYAAVVSTTPMIGAAVAAVAPPTTKPAGQVAKLETDTAKPQSPTTAPSLAPAITNPIAAGQAKKDAGDLLGARKILNDALLSGKLSVADSEAVKKIMSEINQTVVFSPKRFAEDEFGGTYSVQSGDVMKKIADKYEVTWEALCRLNNMPDPKKLRAGQTIKVIHGPFNVVVSKSRFMMDIYLGPPMEKGSLYITSYSVGLGKDDSTPTGAWLVEAGKKIKNPTYYSPRGEGILDADDPKNPLGERWVGLTGIDGHAIGKASYGIHGTIDETSIGKMESMGCIRMHNADVEWVFDLLVEGKSTVLVKE